MAAPVDRRAFPLAAAGAAHWFLHAFSSHASLHASHAGPNHLWMEWIGLATGTLALTYVGSAFYRSAFKALRRGTSNMDTLIALGASVAYGYSAVAFAGFLAGRWRTLPDLYFMEATGLLALISLGHYLEARARASAGSAIHELLELAPATALRMDDAAPQPSPSVTASRLSRLTIIDSRATTKCRWGRCTSVTGYSFGPGDRVPIDAVVIDGRSSWMNLSSPASRCPSLRGPGDTVIGGTINHDGRLIIRVTRTGAQTALAQIVRLVEKAQSSKPPVQKLADRISAVFVPAVLGIALITAVGWYAWGHTHGWETAQTWAMLAKAVCSVLIIACPCALGLAIPAALMVGTGLGARRGILIRDIDALQKAEQIDTVVMDKTGTVTQGKPEVTDVLAMNGMTEEELLRLAASAEQYSEHPLAKAIVAYARDRGIRRRGAGFVYQPSRAWRDGDGIGRRTILVGNNAVSR